MLLNIGETGITSVTNTIDGGSTAAITFNNTYNNPVVIVQAIGAPTFSVARAKDVTSTSATIFLQDDTGSTITSGTYEISYLVIEKGTYILDGGHILEAGHINTTASHSQSANDGWETIGVAGSFSDPLVLHSPNSYNSGRFFATSARNVTRADFQITREIGTQPNDNTIEEKIGYLVLERSQGKTGGFVRYETGSLETSNNVSNAVVGFSGPVFVSGQELNGDHGYYAQTTPITQSERWRFVAEGNDSTYVEIPGIRDASDTKITTPQRSYNVSVLDVATNTFDEHAIFDVYGNTPNLLTTGQADSTDITDVNSFWHSTIIVDTSFSRGGQSSFRVDTDHTSEPNCGITLKPQTWNQTDTYARAEAWVLVPRGQEFRFGLRYHQSGSYLSAKTLTFYGTGEWQLVTCEDDSIPAADAIGHHVFIPASVGDPSTRFWVDDSMVVTSPVQVRIRNAQSMANFLYSLPRNGEKKVVVLSHDEPKRNRLDGQLEAAMYDIGASKTIYGGTFQHRSAYLLVGEPGISEGNALVELYAGDVNSDPDAYIDQEFFLTNSFGIHAEEPSVRDVGHAVEKIAFAVFDTGNLAVNEDDYTPIYDGETLYTYGGEAVYNEYTFISVGSIESGESFGTFTTILFIDSVGNIPTDESVGTPSTLPQPVVLTPDEVDQPVEIVDTPELKDFLAYSLLGASDLVDNGDGTWTFTKTSTNGSGVRAKVPLEHLVDGETYRTAISFFGVVPDGLAMDWCDVQQFSVNRGTGQYIVKDVRPTYTDVYRFFDITTGALSVGESFTFRIDSMKLAGPELYTQPVAVTTVGITSQETVGAHSTLPQPVALGTSGIGSGEVNASPTVLPQPVVVDATGNISTEEQVAVGEVLAQPVYPKPTSFDYAESYTFADDFSGPLSSKWLPKSDSTVELEDGRLKVTTVTNQDGGVYFDQDIEPNQRVTVEVDTYSNGELGVEIPGSFYLRYLSTEWQLSYSSSGLDNPDTPWDQHWRFEFYEDGTTDVFIGGKLLTRGIPHNGGKLLLKQESSPGQVVYRDNFKFTLWGPVETQVGGPRVALNPDAIGIHSAERVMETAQVLPQPVTLGVSSGISTEESVGTPEALPQPVTLITNGADYAEFGTPQINMRLKNVGGIDLETGIDLYEDSATFEYGDFEHYYIDALGGHSVKSVVRLTAEGIPATDEHGVGAVLYGISPSSIESGAVFGDVVALQTVIMGNGIPSEEAVGTPFRVTNTFIKSRIRDFDEDLWFTLFDKEQYCYDQTVQKQDPASYGSPTPTYMTVEGREVYEPKFQELQQAIYAWLDIPRKGPFKDFMNGLYSYIIFNRMYGTDGSLLPNSQSSEIFNMDGYVERIKNDPVEYYHDYAETCTYDDVETTTTCTEETPNLDADIALIQGAYDNQELPLMQSLTAQYQDVVSTKTHDLMFTDYPLLEVVNKDQMTNQIFVDMEYQRIYESMNVGLALPPIIPRPVAEAA